jgi:indolepyruvate decarboxylase
VDADADRFDVASELTELAEKLQAPVAAINAAKAVIDETLPHYLGIYAGKASEPGVRETIEGSDCLIAIGYRPIEVTTGDFTATLPADTIHARGYSVDVGADNYQAVTLREVLRAVIAAAPQVLNRAPRRAAAPVAGTRADGSAKLTQAAYWQALQGYLRPGDVLYVDNGTSFVIFGLRLPPNCTFIGSINWGSIGYSVGALLGALTAAPNRRHILFIGDGSFQVSAQELSTILRHDYKPVIFLINNGGYTIERGYLGKAEPYNDVANWAYADLPRVFRPDTSARSFVVRTVSDLQNALSTPNDRMIFVESIMDRHDAPTAVIMSSNKGADLDYGPRGPQYRENLQLRPPVHDASRSVG